MQDKLVPVVYKKIDTNKNITYGKPEEAKISS
jgi:hypothetical protein